MRHKIGHLYGAPVGADRPRDGRGGAKLNGAHPNRTPESRTDRPRLRYETRVKSMTRAPPIA